MGYKKLFWGFIFLFDFRLGGLDIMPDIIAYILFYQGLTMLEEKNEFFKNARAFALPMIFISIFDLYQVPVPIGQLGTLGTLGILFAVITTVIAMLMVYNICIGIKEEARKINDSELELKAENRWKLYLFINVVLMVGIVLPGLLGVLLFMIIILSTLSYLLMLDLMSEASNKLV